MYLKICMINNIIWVNKTKYYRLNDLQTNKQKTLFSHGDEDRKHKMRVLICPERKMTLLLVADI